MGWISPKLTSLYFLEEHLWVISQHLIGVKVHGHGNWVYLVDENVKGGANLMVEVLRLTLLDLETL